MPPDNLKLHFRNSSEGEDVTVLMVAAPYLKFPTNSEISNREICSYIRITAPKQVIYA